MNRLNNGWKIALWCVAGTAVSVGLAWLISYAPWTEKRGFQLGAIWIALVCAVLDIIHTLLKDSVKQKPCVKSAARIMKAIYWLAWVCYGATLI